MSTLHAALVYDDTTRAIEFLRSIGFTERLLVRGEDGSLQHGEYAWRDDGGSVMLGGVRSDSDLHQPPGSGSVYLVVPGDDDVDAVHATALAHGAVEAQAPTDQDYGGRGSTVRDHEGNLWSFGSYAGASG